MKRRSFIVAGSVGTMAALTGCVQAKSGGGGTTSSGSGPVKLTFSSYAFQEPTVKAVEEIVKSWNAAHPDIQVELQKVDPSSVHDKLVTQFAGNTAPDIIHDESADISGFTRQGYLTDLKPLIPADLKSAIPQGTWDSCTFDGKVTGVPLTAQLYVVFANTKMLKEAGITVPTAGINWTWDDLMANAKKLTAGDRSGFAWGMKSPTAGLLSMAMNYDGKYFYGNEAKPEIKIGEPELKLPRMLKKMLEEKSMAANSVSLSGSDVLPGFFGGKYAMFMGGNFQAVQVAQKAPSGFEWTMLPPLKGTSIGQTANPQTLSIARQSKAPDKAMQFIAYFAQAQNLAKFAEGDALLPVTKEASEVVKKNTAGKFGWDALLSSPEALVAAPMTKADKYSQWKSEVGNPTFQEFFSGKIDEAAMVTKLTQGWQKANS
ncbi:ABC transporter substrate-binding protein [Mariniluteicoccus flavus]